MSTYPQITLISQYQGTAVIEIRPDSRSRFYHWESNFDETPICPGGPPGWQERIVNKLKTNLEAFENNKKSMSALLPTHDMSDSDGYTSDEYEPEEEPEPTESELELDAMIEAANNRLSRMISFQPEDEWIDVKRTRKPDAETEQLLFLMTDSREAVPM